MSYKQALMMGNRSMLEVEVERNKERRSWRVTLRSNGREQFIAIPANFANDFRDEQEFVRNLLVAFWPTSLAADFARKESAAAKKAAEKNPWKCESASAALT